ncbi:MAG: hypothetical protein SFV32_08770 [Opitutaceae bacterium]|nr:hypothetical protein [Opitutaceae bacterium]
MELSLQPQASACFLTHRPFSEGERVVCHLVRVKSGELVRYDVAETAVAEYVPEGSLACRWVRVYKPRKAGENPERELKLTAENLFMSLTDPSAELTLESTRLVQFLALMLERKRVLRPKGLAADGRQQFEHAKTKQLILVPAGELSPEFFILVQEQLAVLIAK